MNLRPSHFLKALGLPLVGLALFAVAGGHWAVLQSIAWSQMLWTYSQEAGSLIAGAKKTFSGEAPCSMCHNIEQAKKEEKKAPATLSVEKKHDTALVAFEAHVPPPLSQDCEYFPLEGSLVFRSEAPPTPVPRVRA